MMNLGIKENKALGLEFLIFLIMLELEKNASFMIGSHIAAIFNLPGPTGQ